MRKAHNTNFKPPFLKNFLFDETKASSKDFPFNIPVFTQTFEIKFRRPVTIFVGENGAGKSTLLELIAQNCGFNVLGGSRHHLYQSQLGEANKPLSQLTTCARLSWLPKVTSGFFLRAETFFSFLEYIVGNPDWPLLEDYYGGNLLKKSHGEAFLAFFANRLQHQGIYLLDEPEAALSPRRQIEFLKILNEIEERANAQVIIVTHSPLLMAYPHADIHYFRHDGITAGDFKTTDHFRVMKDFYQDPQEFVQRELARKDEDESYQ